MDEHNKGWLILEIAGIFEIVWAVSLDLSNGFTNLFYDALVVIFLALSIYMLDKALSHGIPVGTGYSVWTGIGAIGTIAVSALMGNEIITTMKVIFIAMIIIGIVGLQMTSNKKEE